jgi:Domain of unknown function (DUF4124)
MKGKMLGPMVAVGLVLGLAMGASAEIYFWTDEQGAVHMTNQWANVPESARSRVSVRESSAAPSEGAPAMEQATLPVEPFMVKQPSLQMAPDLEQTLRPAAPAPAVTPDSGESSVLIPPSDRAFIHRPKKPSRPFPFNVRLDPFDPNFVWVGRNRVPKDTFTYPHVSLDQQAQFRNRIRALEQRRSAPRKTFPTQPAHP